MDVASDRGDTRVGHERGQRTSSLFGALRRDEIRDDYRKDRCRTVDQSARGSCRKARKPRQASQPDQLVTLETGATVTFFEDSFARIGPRYRSVFATARVNWSLVCSSTSMPKITEASRDHIADENFAFPKERKEPIHDAAHVRNAIARFKQVKGVTDSERDAAWKRIKSAAKKHNVELNEQDWREIS